jgi:hypothetical protein
MVTHGWLNAWTIEAVDLYLAGRHRGRRVRSELLVDGPQLLVRRFGRVVAYCVDEADLAGLGVDMSQMAGAARW